MSSINTDKQGKRTIKVKTRQVDSPIRTIKVKTSRA